MHWRYYQKAITAYFAASNAISAQAQQQAPFVLPGDGGLPYLSDIGTNFQVPRPTVSSLGSQRLAEFLIENVSVETSMRNSISRFSGLLSTQALPIGAISNYFN